MNLPHPVTIFIGLITIAIIIAVTTSNYHHGKSFYHTWTGRSHYCAKCGAADKDCKCPRKEGYTTGCGCGA